MTRRIAVLLQLALIALVVLGGCSPAGNESVIPTEIIEANDAFLRSLAGEALDSIGETLPQGQRDANASQLAAIQKVLQPGPIDEIKHGAYGRGSRTMKGARRLISQIENNGRYFVVVVDFQNRGSELTISDFHFREVPFDVEARNQLDLNNRSVGSLMGIVAGLASLGFILWCLYDCYRSRPRFVWLWLLGITICMPAILVNWGTGKWTQSEFELILMGMSVSQIGRIHPLFIHVGLPTGALVWWIVRSRARLGALYKGNPGAPA